MRAAYFLCFVMFILLSGCKKEQSSAPADLLFDQTWYNTIQESEGDFFVFKQVPPSPRRGYESFRLEANGQFQEQGIAPADGLEFHPGIWTREDDNKYRIRFLDNTRQGYLLEVKLIDKQTLHARRVY